MIHLSSLSVVILGVLIIFDVNLNSVSNTVGISILSILYKLYNFTPPQGTEANSEPETRAIAETIQQHRNNIRIYLSFHSYGKHADTKDLFHNTQSPAMSNPFAS